MEVTEKITISVPATTANLGPGFDCLGLALSLYNRYTFYRSDEYGFTKVLLKYKNLDNLVIVAAKKTYEYLRRQEIPFTLGITEAIPTTRGLGSSASCIVAGIMIANYLSEASLSKDEILNIATMIEGHSDNVAPAIFGNLVAGFMVDKKVMYTIYKTHSDLNFFVLIPKFELPTKELRKILPTSMSYSTAISNMSRAINIPKALEEGDIDKLYYLLNDLWHEPYRMPLITDSSYFKDYSIKNNIPFCISGSGPSLLFITINCDNNNINNIIMNDLQQILIQNKLSNKWEIRILKSDLYGAFLKVE